MFLPPIMSPDLYAYWRHVADRYAPRDSPAAGDLLHDAALAVGGLPVATEGEDARVFVGVLRMLAKQGRRADHRRVRREGRFGAEPVAVASTHEPVSGAPLPMPPLTSDQWVLLALLAGDYDRGEIAHLLGVSPQALRQRIATLRRRLTRLCPGGRSTVADVAVRRLAERRSVEEVALRARAIALARRRGTVVALDPDGHPVSLRSDISAGPHHAFPSGDHSGENTAP